MFHRANSFELYGLMVFENCVFNVDRLDLKLHRSQVERKHSTTMHMLSVRKYTEKQNIEFKRTKFPRTKVVVVLALDVVRGLSLVGCEVTALVAIGPRVFPGQSGNARVVLNILFENCALMGNELQINPESRATFLFATFKNSTFYNWKMTRSFEWGAIGLSFDTCKIFSHDTTNRIVLNEIMFLRIEKCTFTVFQPKDCFYGCSVRVKGLTSHKSVSLAFSYAFGVTVLRTFNILNSVFHGDMRATVAGGAISCVDMNLNISDCIFRLSEQHGNLPSLAGFIHHKSSFESANSYLHNVTLNASQIKEPASLLNAGNVYALWDVKVVHILCAPTFRPAWESETKSLSLSCETHCENGYTLEAAKVTLSTLYTPKTGFVLQDISGFPIPKCHPCPVGAVCQPFLQGLPNYWGFKNPQGQVIMIRCPESYCCTNSTSCTGIDSCRAGRTGTLCGACSTNLTESLFSPKCLPKENCHSDFIVALYFLSALVYCLFLLVSESVKNQTLGAFKKLSEVWKQKRRDRKCLEKKSEETQDTNKQNEDNIALRGSADVQATTSADVTSPGKSFEVQSNPDGGIKYIQILFYYVQDASLFKVYLPSDEQQGQSFLIKILQFSPDFLTAFFDMCFKHGFTPVAKLCAQTLFGPCVMIFISLTYLIQVIFSKVAWVHSNVWVTVRSRLLQAFLLTVLFSFQKVVIGAFSLVQCVEVHEKQVLYIQGDVECFSWWQNLIQLYIWLNIVPLLIVFSHVPFCVQDKTMSVKMFIWNCLFPLPALLWFKVRRLTKMKQKKTGTEVINLQESEASLHDVKDPSGHNSSNKLEEAFPESVGSADVCCGPEGDNLRYIDEEGSSFDEDVPQSRRSASPEVTEIQTCDKATAQTDKTNTKNNTTSDGKDSEDDTQNEAVIVDTLLKHYRSLKLFGIHFTWLGIHQAYRVALVVCNTYITEPLPKLWAMTAMLMLVAFAFSLSLSLSLVSEC